MPTLRISAGPVTLTAELNDSPTAQLLWDALPMDGSANRWGDEIYFAIPIDTEGDRGACAEVEVGEIAFWPPGNAFCIFWGPTPASSGSQPMAASPVNVLGKVEGDATQLGRVASGARVRLEREA
ncbi:MAG: cyclophilin-like fold protein [Caldilineaceae bacterium]